MKNEILARAALANMELQGSAQSTWKRDPQPAARPSQCHQQAHPALDGNRCGPGG